jgi:hypothetical protein
VTIGTENSKPRTIVVTGAFSYTGKDVTRLLLDRRLQIRTLTYHLERTNEFAGQVEPFPYNFEDPEQLERSLRGASCLINTYWGRFPRGQSTFEVAVKTRSRLSMRPRKRECVVSFM